MRMYEWRRLVLATLPADLRGMVWEFLLPAPQPRENAQWRLITYLCRLLRPSWYGEVVRLWPLPTSCLRPSLLVPTRPRFVCLIVDVRFSVRGGVCRSFGLYKRRVNVFHPTFCSQPGDGSSA